MRLADLRILPGTDNARVLSGPEYDQLVANLQHDGVLTSAPLIHNGTVLSGNHRVQAAMQAGIVEADVIEIVGDLTPDRARAIQLSHNAIVGRDDHSVLKRLYDDLDVEWRRYSGLTDDSFKMLAEIDFTGLGIGSPTYHEITFLFLPEERDRFEDTFRRVAKDIERRSRKAGESHLGRFEDFDRVFNAVVAVKQRRGVHNSAVALRMLADLAMERLAQDPDC